MMQGWLTPRLHPSTGSWQIPADYRALLNRKSPSEQELHPLEAMFGEVLVSKAGEEGGTIFTKTLGAVGGILGVYFAAQSCPASRGFSRLLSQFCQDQRTHGRKVEVVLVSQDLEEINFRELFHHSPGLAVLFADRERRAKLTSDLRVTSLPTLIFLDVKSLQVVTWDGVGLVRASAERRAREKGEAGEYRGTGDGVGLVRASAKLIAREKGEAGEYRGTGDTGEHLEYGGVRTRREGSGDRCDRDLKTSLHHNPNPNHCSSRRPGSSRDVVGDHQPKLASLPMFKPLHPASRNLDGAHPVNSFNPHNKSGGGFTDRFPDNQKPFTPVFWSPSAVQQFMTSTFQSVNTSLLKPVARFPAGLDSKSGYHQLPETTGSAFSPVKRSTRNQPVRPTAVVHQEQNKTLLEQTLQKQLLNLHANTKHDKRTKTETWTSNSVNRILKTASDKNNIEAMRRLSAPDRNSDEIWSTNKHAGEVVTEGGRSSASEEVSRVLAKRPVAVISLARRDPKVKVKGHALQRSRSFFQTFPASARSSSAHHQFV